VETAGFILTGLLFDFWLITVNPGFLFCCGPLDEVLASFGFIKHKHAPLRQLVFQQPKYKHFIFKCFIFRWQLPYESPGMLLVSKIVLSPYFLTILPAFSAISSAWPADGRLGC
jgi:hypothetical protein